MIGLLGNYSSVFLIVFCVGMTLLFGIPLLVRPIQWACVLRWQLPDHKHLAIYFGRCLGSVICVLAFFGLRAASYVPVQRYYFDIILANFVIQTLIHIYGAVRKIQPLSETLEIGFWAGLIVVTLAFYPVVA
jgi:hypothetical protein